MDVDDEAREEQHRDAREERGDEEEEELCRYCFDGPEEGTMLSGICACTGGQKHVHLDCLRRWQRMVLVSQPTHPVFYQDDVRHHKCNVCAADFNIPPPTRHELMQSFTGAELAALISEGCIIGSHRVFSEELERQMVTMPLVQRLVCGYKHWIRGAYLITGVAQDDGTVTLPVRTDATLDRLRERLGVDLSVDVAGKKHTLVAGAGSFAGVQAGDVGALRSALNALKAPATLVLSTGAAPDCGEDHVTAVNLTRPIRLPPIDVEGEDKNKSKKNNENNKRMGGEEEGEEEADDDDDDDDGDEQQEDDGGEMDRGGGIVLQPPSQTQRRRRRASQTDDGDDDDGDDDGEGEYSYDGDVDGGPWRSWRQEAWRVVAAATARVTSEYPGASSVQITHYQGGPCDPDEIVACVVPGGVRRGWTVVTASSLPGSGTAAAAAAASSSTSSAPPPRGQVDVLASAVRLAHSRAARRCEEEVRGRVAGGQTVRLVGLKARPDLNGEVGLALRFERSTGRWLMRLRNGDGKQVKPENLEPLEGGGGRVLAFWGDARWSRAQLLGEIARGHWGLCRAGVSEFTAAAGDVYEGLESRLAFAPVTEMTEDFMTEARRDMSRFRVRAEGMAQEVEGRAYDEGDGGGEMNDA